MRDKLQKAIDYFKDEAAKAIKNNANRDVVEYYEQHKENLQGVLLLVTPPKEMSDEQISLWGKQWKEAIGMNPYRMFADQDFMAGATAVRDYLINDVESDIRPDINKLPEPTPLEYWEISKDMKVYDSNGDIGTVIEWNDIHNVHISFDKGGSGLICMDPNCHEYERLYSYLLV